ncbi:calcium channel subunit cch1 [Fusarium longipes]|uniref:Calcium channel subunit cch1 n=1 Tax=Fusarium longipes TaxID=694270 RepID=A0A395RUJ6_9HYPO|nr:calcium channel subunit cch1 [Fusarium longipes]
MAHNSRFENMASRFSPSRLRNSLRRSSSASTSTQASYSSVNTVSSSAAVTINNIISRQPSLLNLEAERRSFGSELSLLEPRPIVYWGSVEERIG